MSTKYNNYYGNYYFICSKRNFMSDSNSDFEKMKFGQYIRERKDQNLTRAKQEHLQWVE